MAKDKVIEQTTEVIKNNSNILMNYMPLILGIVCLLACYFLYKKIQTLNSQTESINKIEKQLTKIVEEQGEINNINAKRSQGLINQLNYLTQIMNSANINDSKESIDNTQKINLDKDEVQEKTVQFKEEINNITNVKKEKKDRKDNKKKVVNLEKEVLVEEDTSSDEN